MLSKRLDHLESGACGHTGGGASHELSHVAGCSQRCGRQHWFDGGALSSESDGLLNAGSWNINRLLVVNHSYPVPLIKASSA